MDCVRGEVSDCFRDFCGMWQSVAGTVAACNQREYAQFPSGATRYNLEVIRPIGTLARKGPPDPPA
jgi:hypothetical protein